MTKIAAALLFLGLNTYALLFLGSEELIPDRERFASFPLQVGDWRCPAPEELDPKARRILGASDTLLCTYTDEASEAPGARSVGLYVGYHASQVRRGGGGRETAIHPPEHCLPGSGWAIIDASRQPVDFAGLPAAHGLRDAGPTAKRFVIAKGEARQLVYFWYQGQGRVISANEDVILWRFWGRATRGRTDAALVRFTTPILHGDVDAAEARFQRFAAAVVPLLPPYVPE